MDALPLQTAAEVLQAAAIEAAAMEAVVMKPAAVEAVVPKAVATEPLRPAEPPQNYLLRPWHS